MDYQSIIDRSSPSPAVPAEGSGASSIRPATPSVSAGIAAANALSPKSSELGPRFPPEERGRSLAEMACSDLDAALQLLAERAQYITAASGAAIALRRGEHNDMRCRASAGSNAPELGALLSTEYGLSGESIRTRQALRCDDAERDPRVNREGCRRLGIASVVVMPIVSDEQALGVFELFSGKPNAFDERDLTALRRLSEMAEMSVKLAVAAHATSTIHSSELDAVSPDAAALEVADPQRPVDGAVETRSVDAKSAESSDETSEAIRLESLRLQPVAQTEIPRLEIPRLDLPRQEIPPPPIPPQDLPGHALKLPASERTQPEPPKKPLFWSAAPTTNSASADEAAGSAAVPPMLRNLQKCQACGFPVSHGRLLCVECEEKRWRGQRLPKPSASIAPTATLEPTTLEPTTLEPKPVLSAQKGSFSNTSPSVQAVSRTAAASPADPASAFADTTSVEAPAGASGDSNRQADLQPNVVTQNVSEKPASPASDHTVPFLSTALPSESWFAANKYILAALAVVGIVIGVVAWLR